MRVLTGKAVVRRAREMPDTVGRRMVRSPRLRVLRLLWETSPGLTIALGLFIVADGFLPILSLVALGRAVGHIPAARADRQPRRAERDRPVRQLPRGRPGRGGGTITVLVSHRLGTVLVSHRFGTVHMADQIIVMDGGRVAECGNHQTLMDRDGIYAELFNLQAEGYRP